MKIHKVHIDSILEEKLFFNDFDIKCDYIIKYLI